MKLIKGQVFKRYLFSYLSIALAICMSLGLALTFVSTKELRQAEYDLYKGRLRLVADYTEQQIIAMETVCIDIKTNLCFQPFYLKRSVVNDLELIKAFKQYGSYSGWIDEYYLWYQDISKVYSPNGTYSEEVFLEQLMGGLLPDSFDSIEGKDAMKFGVLNTRPDSFAVVMPFYFGTSRYPTGKCCLIFMVKLNDFHKMIYRLTGSDSSAAYTLTYNGIKVLGSSNSDKMINAVSTEGKIGFAMSPSSEMEKLSAFSVLMRRIIIGFAAAAALIAAVTAWRNYKPIRRLYRLYSDENDHARKGSNELQTIENVLHNALSVNTYSQKQLGEQLRQMNRQKVWLKQQLVIMIISGNDSPMVQQQMQEMGFDMEYSNFSMLFIHINEGKLSSDIVKCIEDLATDKCSLYAAELQANRELAVLLNYDEDETCEGMLAMLSDALLAQHITARIQISEACQNLGSLASASIEALKSQPILIPEPDTSEPDVDIMDHLIALIEAGNTQQSIALLDSHIAQIENTYPSYIMRLYMLNEFKQQVNAKAYQMGIMIPPKENTAINSKAVAEQMRNIVERMCSGAAQKSKASSNMVENDVTGYVKEHCIDLDISLSSVAEAMGISTKQVSRLLKSGVGVTFKEYILQLRMEAAKNHLQNDTLSIAQIAEKVGYVNISHFIKCFKQYTSFTPGEWKRIFQSKC